MRRTIFLFFLLLSGCSTWWYRNPDEIPRNNPEPGVRTQQWGETENPKLPPSMYPNKNFNQLNQYNVGPR